MEKKKKVTGSAVRPISPVEKLQHPLLHTIATEIVADDAKFIPQYTDTGDVNLLANVAEYNPLPVAAGETITVDCGFSMKLPVGYKINIVSKLSGFIVSGFRLEEGRVKVNMTNLSRDVGWIEEEVFAVMSIEPIYAFRWIRG